MNALVLGIAITTVALDMVLELMFYEYEPSRCDYCGYLVREGEEWHDMSDDRDDEAGRTRMVCDDCYHELEELQLDRLNELHMNF